MYRRHSYTGMYELLTRSKGEVFPTARNKTQTFEWREHLAGIRLSRMSYVEWVIIIRFCHLWNEHIWKMRWFITLNYIYFFESTLVKNKAKGSYLVPFNIEQGPYTFCLHSTLSKQQKTTGASYIHTKLYWLIRDIAPDTIELILKTFSCFGLK